MRRGGGKTTGTGSDQAEEARLTGGGDWEEAVRQLGGGGEAEDWPQDRNSLKTATKEDNTVIYALALYST